jgi:hypothetical protein
MTLLSSFLDLPFGSMFAACPTKDDLNNLVRYEVSDLSGPDRLYKDMRRQEIHTE